MRYATRVFFCMVMGLSAHSARADEGLFQYHTTNIQLLEGWDYEVGEKQRTVATLEHYNQWTYGDLFFFIDGTRTASGDLSAYGEFSPRLSLSKISGRDLSVGPISDFYLSGTWEKGRNGVEAFLYGGAVNLDVPGFQLFRLDGYVRDTPGIPGQTWQGTWVWRYKFTASGLRMVCEGFADVAGDEGTTYHANQMVVPRVLVDVGDALGRQSDVLFAGIEWQYWHNKYGIDGVTESVPQLQVKWVFD